MPFSMSGYLAIIFVSLALGNILISINYSYAYIFFTLMVTFSFYPMHGHGSVDAYLLNRVFDVFSGVLLAIIIESCVFPKVFLTKYREMLPQIFKALAVQMNHPTEASYEASTVLINKLCSYAEQIAYEPYVLMSKRRHLCLKLPVILQYIACYINEISFNKKQDLSGLANIYNELSLIDYNSRNRIMPTFKYLLSDEGQYQASIDQCQLSIFSKTRTVIKMIFNK